MKRASWLLAVLVLLLGGAERADGDLIASLPSGTDSENAHGELFRPWFPGRFPWKATDSTLGTFNTQMKSLDLTGNVAGHSVEIMLDPSSASTGKTTVSDNGGGALRIDSFFDISYRDLARLRWFAPQSNGPLVVTLQLDDGPASQVALLSVAGMSFVGLAWRCRRAAA